MGTIEKKNKDEHESSYAHINPHAKYYAIEKHNAMAFERLPGSLRGKKILELGFGQGDFLIEIIEKGGDAYGIDIAESAKHLLEKKMHGRRLARKPKVRIETLTNKLPYATSSFDAVVALHVIEHIKDEPAMLREIMRVLKKGGTFLVAVPQVAEGNELDKKHFHTEFHYREYSVRSLNGALKKAGFENVKIHKYQSFYDLIAGFLVNELPGKLLSRKKHVVKAVQTNGKQYAVQKPSFVLRLQAALVKIAVAIHKLDSTTAWMHSHALFAEAKKK